jgi:hypothetical protein
MDKRGRPPFKSAATMNRERQTDEEANPQKKQKRMEEEKCKKKTVRPKGQCVKQHRFLTGQSNK